MSREKFVEEKLPPEEVIRVRRETLGNNLETYSVTLPEELIGPDGLPTEQSLGAVEGIVPSFTYARYMFPDNVGTGSVRANLPNLLSIKGCRVNFVSEPGDKIFENSQGKQAIHFTPSKEMIRIRPTDPLTVNSRERSLLKAINNSEDGVYYLEIGSWLQGQLNEIVGDVHIYLSDLLQPSAKEDIRMIGLVLLTEKLGLENRMITVFYSCLHDIKEHSERIEQIFEEKFRPLLDEIQKYLGQYDNPDELILTFLNFVRSKTKKYFSS